MYSEKQSQLGKHSVSAVPGTQRQVFRSLNRKILIILVQKEVAKKLVIGKSLISNCVFAPDYFPIPRMFLSLNSRSV